MARTHSRTTRRQQRHHRVRSRVSGDLQRPRLVVFRSAKHISCQIIDDVSGKTLLAASDRQLTSEPKVAKGVTRKVAVAEAVGKLLAERAKVKKVTKVVFDTAGFRYHGRIRALADGARAGGLHF